MIEYNVFSCNTTKSQSNLSGYVWISQTTTGANAFAWEIDIVDAGNRTNTYINFRNAGATSDWCYLRQIGGANTYKLSLDFHDDGNDAKFCIRNVQSAGVTTDVITEVFTVDNGNVSCTGQIVANGNLYVGNGNSYPDLRMGSTDGNNIGIATTAGAFSSSSAVNDMVIRSINRMILQSGSGGYGILIDTANNISTRGNISTSGSINITSANQVLNLGQRVEDNLIRLWYDGTATYGLGVNASVMRYNVPTGASHKFYTSTTNTFTIDASGNISSTGALTSPNINLTTSANGNNVLYIKSTITNANNCIWFRNNLDCNVYVGICGSTFGGNYQNNFFIESANGSIILNSQGKVSASNPSMIIHSSGNIGIGTTNPQTELELYDTINPKIYLNHNGTSRYFISGTSTSIDIGNDNGTSKTIRFMPDNVERMIINSIGNVGIGTNNPSTKLHIEHSSTSFNAANGGLYLYNPNNTANNCSVLGARIGGSTANKAGISLDVSGNYGWSMYINGSDTTNKTLRFNSSWDGSGTERLQIRGSDGYTIFTGNMQIASSTGSGSLIIGNYSSAVSLTLSDIATAVWKIETGSTNLTFSNDSPTGGTFISKMIITSGGNLLVSGDISAFANMSDRRLKHNINDLSINCIDLLNNIKPVEFIWNDMDEIINIKRNTHDHGFIAQDIELLLPNLVNQYDKYKSIKYEKLTPYLVKGSQELYKLIQDLQVDNIRQQQQIIDLQNQINMIKSQLS